MVRFHWRIRDELYCNLNTKLTSFLEWVTKEVKIYYGEILLYLLVCQFIFKCNTGVDSLEGLCIRFNLGAPVQELQDCVNTKCFTSYFNVPFYLNIFVFVFYLVLIYIEPVQHVCCH